MDINELNIEYREADSVDKPIFAEQRSNVLLANGDHYTRRYSQFWGRLRESSRISEDTRIRLTMNHIGRIMDRYTNALLSYAPGASVKPKNEKELQDQKVAQINQVIWQDAKDRHNLNELVGEFADDFNIIGEVHGYIYFDPSIGPIRGYEQLLDDNGEPVLNEMGEPVNDKNNPVHQGDFVFKRLLGFNLLRNPEAESFQKSEYLIVREMASIADLKKVYAGDDKKLSYIQESAEKTFKIFDITSGEYRISGQHELMLRTHLYRPSKKYPKGMYFICTEFGILEEGELPFGIFPIESQCFRKVPTSCRGRSKIKDLRPYQGEINRASSKQAEHQMTLGDDKLILQGNTKATSGTTLPGIRVVKVTSGAPPVILEGRNGAQYVDYALQKINEMYDVADVEYNEIEKAATDPFALLFKSAKQRKKFMIYTKRFEDFLIRFVQLYLRLAKEYIDEEMYAQIVGTREVINFQEYKSSTDLGYQIVVEASNEDIEEKMGRQIVMSQILQYASGQLGPEMIGEIIRAMPYANVGKVTSTLTLNNDNAENMILALDRGEQIPIFPYDDAPYMIGRLTRRMRESDFRLLKPEIQEMYFQAVQAYEQVEAQKRRELIMAESQLIPMGGAKVKVDYYINDNPEKPTKTTRATVPAQAVEWLLQKLDMQGAMIERQDELVPPDAQIAIAQQAGAMAPQPELGPAPMEPEI